MQIPIRIPLPVPLLPCRLFTIHISKKLYNFLYSFISDLIYKCTKWKDYTDSDAYLMIFHGIYVKELPMD